MPSCTASRVGPVAPRAGAKTHGRQLVLPLPCMLMTYTPTPAQLSVTERALAFVEPESGLTLRATGARLNWQGSGALDVTLGYPVANTAAVMTALATWLLPDVVTVQLRCEVISAALQQNQQPIQGIRNIVVVASGKGGVGKSTTAANLALALAADGVRVGLLDADIYGPSQARMMGLTGQKPTSEDGKTFAPLMAHGVKVMSIGLLVDDEQPMVWRGPMVTQALTQLLHDCRWGELDYLIVDMPPGTGDIQLTLAQRVPVSGAVIVTTPQDIALLDARKGLKMFEKVNVPVLGIIENMSTHICSNCGHEEHVFGAGGGARMAQQYGVALLGELPLHIDIRTQADDGVPTVVAAPHGKLAQAYRGIARRTVATLAQHLAHAGKPMPAFNIEHT